MTSCINSYFKKLLALQKLLHNDCILESVKPIKGVSHDTFGSTGKKSKNRNHAKRERSQPYHFQAPLRGIKRESESVHSSPSLSLSSTSLSLSIIMKLSSAICFAVGLTASMVLAQGAGIQGCHCDANDTDCIRHCGK